MQVGVAGEYAESLCSLPWGRTGSSFGGDEIASCKQTTFRSAFSQGLQQLNIAPSLDSDGFCLERDCFWARYRVTKVKFFSLCHARAQSGCANGLLWPQSLHISENYCRILSVEENLSQLQWAIHCLKWVLLTVHQPLLCISSTEP